MLRILMTDLVILYDGDFCCNVLAPRIRQKTFFLFQDIFINIEPNLMDDHFKLRFFQLYYYYHY